MTETIDHIADSGKKVPKETTIRDVRNKVAQVLVKNNLRTDQVAIGELVGMMFECYEEGKRVGKSS